MKPSRDRLLCDNLHPQTGERLTQRQNTTQVDMDANGKSHKAANRRMFFDFALSPPKSVSIVALVGDEQRLVEAHDEAVQVALRHLECYATARVRKLGQTAYRTTGNLIGAVFRHDTSRALDPHLHSHDLWRHALEHTRGQDITLAEIQSVTRRRDYVRDTERPGYVASQERLEREWAIVKMARACGPDFRLPDESFDRFAR